LISLGCFAHHLPVCPKDVWTDCIGAFDYSDGSRYVGDWKNSKREGDGTFVWPDGDRYVGKFMNDQMHGPGMFFDRKTGQSQRVTYERGELVRSPSAGTTSSVQSVTAKAQNFPYKNWIFGYPNCDQPTLIRSWADDDSGRLTTNLRNLESPSLSRTDRVSSLESGTQDGESLYTFVYAQDFNEKFIFYKNNTVRIFERTYDGKTAIRFGMYVAATGMTQTNTFPACSKTSKAAEILQGGRTTTNTNDNKGGSGQRTVESNASPKISVPNWVPQACHQEYGWIEDKDVETPTIFNRDGSVCTTYRVMISCLARNGVRSSPVDSRLKNCVKKEQQEWKGKCVGLTKAADRCVAAADYTACLNRQGFIGEDVGKCNSVFFPD